MRHHVAAVTIVVEACGNAELSEEITTTREYKDFARSSSVIMAIQNDRRPTTSLSANGG